MAVTKTVQTALVAWQDLATANQIISSAFSVTTILAGSIGIRIGRRSGTAFSAGWPNVRLEVSFQDSGDRRWTPIRVFTPFVGGTIVNTTLNGAVSAGATTFVVTSATNLAVGDILFLSDTTPSNYELVRVKTVSGTTITPEDPVVNAHVTASIVTDQAEMYAESLDLSTYRAIRAVVDNIGSAQSISVEVQLTTLDTL